LSASVETGCAFGSFFGTSASVVEEAPLSVAKVDGAAFAIFVPQFGQNSNCDEIGL
jgi:hypothetical protein